MTTVAATIAAALADSGVERVFGLPGGEIVELLDEVRKQGIDFVLVRNESSALFMADAYARATGRPAVCMTTLGPGAANAVMGVAHCYLDRSPVLIFTAQKPQSLLPDYTHQVIDQHALFAPITKATVKIQPGNAHSAIPDALNLAVEGRPGPVHLQVSTEDAVAETTADGGAGSPFVPHKPTPVAAHELASAQEILSGARRPLIVAGLGVEPQRPYAAIRALAASVGAPVVVTPKAKGALAADHPLSAGTIGLTSTDPVYDLLEEADCVVAVGFDVVELVKPWTWDRPFIWVAPWSNEDPRLNASNELVGDMSSALFALADVDANKDVSWGEARVGEFLGRPLAAPPPMQSGTLSPQVVLRVMRKVAQRDAFLAVDVGAHKIYSSLAWPAYEPNRFLLSNGLSSMSYALPAAIGAALAAPTSQVLCLTGDAGLAMNMGELGVLRERNLPVVVIVLSDGAIDLIRSHQRRAGKPVFATEFSPPNHAQIGAAFGLAARRVEDEDALSSALAEFLDAQSPALIEVILDPTGYPTTPKSK